jgi:uncharacterized protein YcbK (DUF882 family)
LNSIEPSTKLDPLLLAAIVHLKLATLLMQSWVAEALPLPVPIPASALALALEAQVAAPVEVTIIDINRGNQVTKLQLERDGSYDPAMAKTIAHVFRCKTESEHVIAKRTLAMLAAVSERYGKPIELVSGYRVRRGESRTSPHRDARAIDFKVPGVDLREIRDWLWSTYTEVGIGWYPYDGPFIHMDSRPTMNDTAWTDIGGRYFYNPPWSVVARARGPKPDKPIRRGPGV